MMNVYVSLQHGNLLTRKRMAKASASATWLPLSQMEACTKLTLNASLKLGMHNIFSGGVTVSIWSFQILRLHTAPS